MLKQYMAWFFKGMAMGAADAVPGVSGGTIALIVGIYERFIHALSGFQPRLLVLLYRREFKAIWQAIDGTFLTILLMGILVSLLSVLNLMHWLLQVAPSVVWSFFSGVVSLSLYYLFKEHRWQGSHVILCIIGMVITAGLSFLPNSTSEATPLLLVFSGAIAISAMLLPGISGSFILLLMGVYPTIVQAVHDYDFIPLGWVALGCVLGVLSFTRLLTWALQKAHDLSMSVLLGFVLGALFKLWPWQYEGQWMWPGTYESISGHPAWVMASVCAFVMGVGSVLFLKVRSK